MNYHSDEFIMSHLKEHIYDANIPNGRFIGVFYQGSANYGLDYEGSDVDTKMLVTPSFDEIITEEKPKSELLVRKNDEHTDVKDLRLFCDVILNQSINFLEILFTDYRIINPTYEEEINILTENAEKIAHYDTVKAVKSMYGIILQKSFALEHKYESKVGIIDKFGYDPKQLCHVLRINEFMKRYISGESFKSCLKAENAGYYIDVKRGKHTLSEARSISEKTVAESKEIADNFIKTHTNDSADDSVIQIINEIRISAVKKSIVNELTEKHK